MGLAKPPYLCYLVQYMNQFAQFLQNNNWVLLMAILWTLPWKGVALWKAARLSQKIWFLVLFLVNTLGILEIIYIFAIVRKKEKSPALE